MSINEASINAVRSMPPSGNMQIQQNSANQTNNDENFWGEDGFSFGDLIDIVNPLQHIPVVKDIYRDITGDEISTGSQMAGGTIYGGFIGLISSFVNSTVEQETGKTIAGHAKSAFGIGDETQNPTSPKAKEDVQLAQNNITNNINNIDKVNNNANNDINITPVEKPAPPLEISKTDLQLNKILADMEQQMGQAKNNISQFEEFNLPEPLQYKTERETNPEMHKQYKVSAYSLYKEQIEKTSHNEYIDNFKTNNLELSI